MTVRVAVRILAQNPRHHPDTQHDESEANQPFGPVIQAFRESQIQLQHGDAQRGYRKGAAEGIGHAQSQSAKPVVLHSGDVGDCRQMIVVESVAQPGHQAGAERRI